MMVTAVLALACGIPLAVHQPRFDAFVDLVTIYLVPFGAAMAGILFFWVLGVEKARAEVNTGAARPVGAWWEPVAQYVFVGVAILIIGLQMAFQVG